MAQPLPSRRILAGGAPNFRDAGGFPSKDGRQIKWRTVFRSDDLNDLTEDGVQVLTDLGIRCVVDFRTASEAEHWPDILPSTVTKHVNLPIDAGRVMGRFNENEMTLRKTMGIMVSVYRDLANHHEHIFKEFFSLLMDPGNHPLLFHCTAGKDRTGLAAALFLSALGVSQETVMEDYLFSGVCLREKYIPGVDYPEELKPLYHVEPEFLLAAFEVIEHKFGGMDAFLTKRLDVDKEALGELFLV